ncbi:MAG: fibronectin type III domain-containing protein, partial [Limisphaerales bacterium]
TAPTGLSATAPSTSQIVVRWMDTAMNETGFKVERRTAATPYVQVASLGANVTVFTDSNLLPGTQYFYRVIAFNQVGDSVYSSEVSATTQAAVPVGNTLATFVGVDGVTRGNWKSAYGAEGFQIMGEAPRYPGYLQLSTSGKADFIWNGGTSENRAMEKSGANDRIAGLWYAPDSFTLDLKLTDGKSHRVAFYCLDWDRKGRAQTIEIRDAVSGALLHQRLTAGFQEGKYFVFHLRGHVKVTFTRTGPANAVLSGIFFDPSTAAMPTAPQTGSSASKGEVSFVKLDVATRGNWKGVYGADGSCIPASATVSPSYVQMSRSGQTDWIWAGSVSDARALQKLSGSDRIASTWVAGG